MKRGLKRPIQTYLFHVFGIAMTFYWSFINSTEFGQWTLRILTIVGLISLVYGIVRRNYFEVIDNKLVINENIFRKRIIDLDNIEKFEYEPGPFTSSKIILKDKSKIKYSDSQTDDKELKEFMGQFNIPVE